MRDKNLEPLGAVEADRVKNKKQLHTRMAMALYYMNEKAANKGLKHPGIVVNKVSDGPFSKEKNSEDAKIKYTENDFLPVVKMVEDKLKEKGFSGLTPAEKRSLEEPPLLKSRAQVAAEIMNSRIEHRTAKNSAAS